MVMTIVKSIRSDGLGAFTSPASWESGAPANLTTVEKYTFGSFSGALVQGETVTEATSGFTAKLLDTDNATYMILGDKSGAFTSDRTFTGATSAKTAVITAPATDTSGCIWQGHCAIATDEFTSASGVLSVGGSTVDATRYKELTAGVAASFRDNINVQTNALRYNAANGVSLRSTGAIATVTVDENYFRMSKLQIAQTGSVYAIYSYDVSSGLIEFCIIEAANTTTVARIGNLTILRNNLIVQRATAANRICDFIANATIFNCTFLAPDDLATAPAVVLVGQYGVAYTLTNCALFAGNSASAIKFGTAFTFNHCYSDISGTSGVTQVPYGDVFENIVDATRDFRLKTGSPLIDVGLTDSTHAANDIAGTARPSGSGYDVGCWEFVSGGPPPPPPSGGEILAALQVGPVNARTKGRTVPYALPRDVGELTALVTAAPVICQGFTCQPCSSTGDLI